MAKSKGGTRKAGRQVRTPEEPRPRSAAQLRREESKRLAAIKLEGIEAWEVAFDPTRSGDHNGALFAFLRDQTPFYRRLESMKDSVDRAESGRYQIGAFAGLLQEARRELGIMARATDMYNRGERAGFRRMSRMVAPFASKYSKPGVWMEVLGRG